MSITNTVTEQEYTANGVQVLFSIPFDFMATTEIYVYVDGVQKIVGVNYTLTDSGGNPPSGDPTHVKFGVAPANASKVLIKRITPKTQTLALLSNSSITLLNNALDKLTQIVQENTTAIGDLVSESDLASIESDIAAVEADITALQSSVSTLTSDLNTAESDIDDLEAAILLLQAADITHTADIATNANDIGILQNEMIAVQADVSSALANISALQSRVSNLEGLVGLTYPQNLPNNSSFNITNLLLDKDNYDAVIVEFSIFRKTDTASKYSSGHIFLVWSVSAGAWLIEKNESISFAGVTFSVTGQQVVATTNSLSGTGYSGKIKYNVKKFEV